MSSESSSSPSESPSASPIALTADTQSPTFLSISPTSPPSLVYTENPSSFPTASPTHQPISESTHSPTPEPTLRPTTEPTHSPTPAPTPQPTPWPTSEPSLGPSSWPTLRPTLEPTPQPTLRPSPVSTQRPSVFVPADVCSATCVAWLSVLTALVIFLFFRSLYVREVPVFITRSRHARTFPSEDPARDGAYADMLNETDSLVPVMDGNHIAFRARLSSALQRQ